MSPAREGSFNANFSPDTLDSFKALCKDQSRQYTKVLEKLAELYLGSDGEILEYSQNVTSETHSTDSQPNISSLQQSIEQLETLMSMSKEDIANVFATIERLEHEKKELKESYELLLERVERLELKNMSNLS